jgi:arginine-tRNA-protein transferase
MNLDFKRLFDSVSGCFFDIPARCPYGLDHTAVYRQAGLGRLPDQAFDLFLENGFRRNGNVIYTMNCRGCEACIPIRLRTDEFRPGKNFKKVLGRNRDVDYQVDQLVVDQERLDLCNKFLRLRYPGKESSAADYYSSFFLNSVVQTVEIAYRLDEKLVGVSIVDVTGTALNAVYFYFDPDYGPRSLGTFNILFLLELARMKGFDFVYLGYWIEEVRAMRYKARFKPHHLFRDGMWQSVGS